MSRRAPRADAVRNRERILIAARRAFAKQGAEVPLDVIAAAAGVGPGTLHRHFPTKEALLAAVIADRLDDLADRAAGLGGDPAADFFAFLGELVESGRDNLALASALGGPPNGLIEESAGRLSAALQALLTAAQQAGGVRPDVDVAEVHAILTGVLTTESRLSESRRGLGLQIAIDGLRTAPAEGTRRPRDTGSGRWRGTTARSAEKDLRYGGPVARRSAGLTRLGDNDGMTSDPSWALVRRLSRMIFLDGVRPSRTLGWVPYVAPVVTQGAVGAGHWARGRRRRALAAWASAAGYGVSAWGLGTEAPGRAEVQSLLREFGVPAPAAGGTDTPAAGRRSGYRWFEVASPVAWMIIGVPWGLRHPRRLTALAIAMEAPNAVFYAVRGVWAVHRRRPRTAAGCALAAAGSVARLRAAADEPLR